MVKSFRDLDVWHLAWTWRRPFTGSRHDFPNELFALTAQMRRAAVSIPSNIAEGQARDLRPENSCTFLLISLGSLAELETQLEWQFGWTIPDSEISTLPKFQTEVLGKNSIVFTSISPSCQRQNQPQPQPRSPRPSPANRAPHRPIRIPPFALWLPSQNGLFAEWPQRHSEMTVRPPSPNSLPSAS
jgi:four helix bundle protein